MLIRRRLSVIQPSCAAFAGGLLGLVLLAALPSGACAHPGELDQYGGHFDERTGHYHYHQPTWDLSKRTKEYLKWTKQGASGELIGTYEKADRPDAIWVKIPYRPAFQVLSEAVSAPNRDDKNALVRIWFRYVSPENSALMQDQKYVQWFRKKVVFELDRKLEKQPLTVQFTIDPVTRRPLGMVLLGEENVNVWLVLGGWSFYLLNQDKNPYDKAFVEAEQIARKGKAGLWGRGATQP
jgi:hypothetical protein